MTIAAQLAVAPVEVARFGGIPLAALPANILAAPAAGPIMMWGLTGGIVAGLAGGSVAVLVHLPTRVLVWWIATVARVAARAPFGELRVRHLLALSLSVAIVAFAPGRFATITGCPRSCVNLGASCRATMSFDPPGGKPMMSRMGLVGYVWACAALPSSPSISGSAMPRVIERMIGLLVWGVLHDAAGSIAGVGVCCRRHA